MRRLILSLGIIAILIVGAQLTMNVQPYFEEHFGDCGECHNTPAIAWNESNSAATLLVDGIDDDAVWGDMHNTMYAPASPPHGVEGDEHFQFVRVKISQNDTHLFVIARWADTNGLVDGSDSRTGTRDMFSMIWNINQDDFSLDMWGGAMRSAESGKKLDQVVWIPTAAETGKNGTTGKTGVAGKTYDEAYTSVGKTTDTTNDWTAAALMKGSSYSPNTYYYVEMIRPLKTADGDDDVQFKYDGYYGFAMAYWNQTSGASHFVTYEQFVWVHGADGADPTGTVTVKETVTVDGTTTTTITDSKSEAPFASLFAVLGLFSIGLAVALIRRRK